MKFPIKEMPLLEKNLCDKFGLSVLCKMFKLNKTNCDYLDVPNLNWNMITVRRKYLKIFWTALGVLWANPTHILTPYPTSVYSSVIGWGNIFTGRKVACSISG
jgi:hypothetical protein